MSKSTEISVGLIMSDYVQGDLKILLVHSGGPYFANEIKHPRAWGFPKGLTEPNETLLETGIREFEEETGIKPTAPYESLGNVVYQNGKKVHMFVFVGKFPGKIISNKFKMEWPPKSGKYQEFDECDRGEMFTIEEARKIIMISQEPFLDRLLTYLGEI
jgi:predicted NUDIX family NTP pyrophosphohydrolase